MHANYSIWGWVGASNNDPAQGFNTLKSGPGPHCKRRLVDYPAVDSACFYPRDASWRGTSYDPVSLRVCYKPVFCQNVRTDRPGLWHSGFLRPILHYVLRNIRYLQNKSTFLWNVVPNSGLKLCHGTSIVATCCQLSSTKSGRSERNKLDRRRSTMLTISATVDR